MGLGDFLQALGNYAGQPAQGQMGPMPQNALSRFGSGMSGVANGIQGALQNPGLQQLAQMDTQRRNDEHMNKVFAANPAFAAQLYGAKTNLAKLAKEDKPKYEQVGNALLKILPDGSFEEVYKGKDNLPASIEIANEVEKALAEGDVDRANRLMQIQKVFDKGINPYGDVRQGMGATTPSFNPSQPHPLEPPLGPTTGLGFPDIASLDNPELDALAASLPDVGGNIPLPSLGPQAIPGYGNAVGSIAADKKRLETQALKGVELDMNPLIAGKESDAKLESQLNLEPLIKEKNAISEAVGKNTGEKNVDFKGRIARMPQLESTVDRLSALGKLATYTFAGQARDALARQAGMDVPDSAVARKEYISMVDNEVLPLLRETFGAQFTQKEGESLKVTLGDPNASPEEKDAVLKSFIRTKKLSLNTLARELGEDEPFKGLEKGNRKYNRATGKLE